MATLSNLSSSFHTFYIFRVVEYFGIYFPQAIIATGVLIFTWKVKDKIYAMDDLSKESWAVTDQVLKKVKHQ